MKWESDKDWFHVWLSRPENRHTQCSFKTWAVHTNLNFRQYRLLCTFLYSPWLQRLQYIATKHLIASLTVLLQKTQFHTFSAYPSTLITTAFTAICYRPFSPWNESTTRPIAYFQFRHFLTHTPMCTRWTNKMHSFLQIIFIFPCFALHVSDVLSVHHQEHHLVNCITHLVHSWL